MNLYLQDAIEFVRARMDELSFDNDDMILPAEDDRNFDGTVEKLLPEAAEFVVRAAPAALLEPQGEMGIEDVSSAEYKSDGSVLVTINLSTGFLRLISFKSEDSDIFVTDPVPFDSQKARMQVNPYTRGTYDAPVLVERKTPGKVHYTYFSVREGTPGFVIEKIDIPSYANSGGAKSIFCPKHLGPAVLNRLTGMVLEAYKEVQLAQTFYQKSASYFA